MLPPLSISLTYYRHSDLTDNQERQLLHPERLLRGCINAHQATSLQHKCHVYCCRLVCYTPLVTLKGKVSTANPSSLTLQKAMMSPMIQLAAGLAAAPAASTESKYWAVGSSSASTSTSAAGKPSCLYFLLNSAGKSGMDACRQDTFNVTKDKVPAKCGARLKTVVKLCGDRL